MAVVDRSIFCKPSEERMLLSFAMNNIDKLYSIMSHMDGGDFLHYDHTMIFSILKSLASRGVDKFDLPLIVSEAMTSGIYTKKEDIEYIASIYDLPLSETNFDVVLSAVHDSVSKFRLYRNLKENLDLLTGNAQTEVCSSELLCKVESSIMDLSTRSKSLREPKDLGDGLEQYINDLRDSKIQVVGLQTGYPILDRQLDGLIPGTLNVIAARKKMGKSTLLTNIAIHVAYRSKIPVLYVDTEMTFNEWRNRAIAILAKFSERRIKHGGYTDEEYKLLVERCVNVVRNGRLFHEYMPGYDVDKLVSLYKKYKAKENIGLMVFDYIKEPDMSKTKGDRKEYQVLGDVTTKLKDLAGILDIPALTAVQLNRDNDVADSDRVARYADVVAHWMRYNSKEELEAVGANFERGSHKLVIRDTRRGGQTSDLGIGYSFKGGSLRIEEVPVHLQLADYRELVNSGMVGDA